ncbi:MAG: hypothetical protein HQL34_05215 [Alphaproteobacteria bacterium]|nr:hypothetical protein [Alphaproteobacteria bacterium]
MKPTRRTIPALFLLAALFPALVSAPAAGQDRGVLPPTVPIPDVPAPAPPRPAGAPPAGEGLAVQIPPGWTPLDHVRNAKGEELYLVPPSQNNPNWKDMIAYREVKGYSGGSPKSVLEGSLEAGRQGCPGLVFKPIQEGRVNGYPAAFLTVFCPSDTTGKGGEINLVKVVVGRENLYMVQRTWRTAPFEPTRPPVDSKTIDVWVQYLSRLKPCDTRDPTHPCPVPEK